MSVEKYSWSFNKNAEIWGNDTFDTIGECLSDARESAKEYYSKDGQPVVVYVGENTEFVPQVDAESVLDNIQESAGDFAGEVGGDWCAYDYKRKDQLAELSDALTTVVNDWLKKYGYSPSFYAVENIKEYRL